MKLKYFLIPLLLITLVIAGNAFSKQDSNTIVTPHLNIGVVKGKNVLYCSTFQLAWNELKNKMVKEDIKLVNEPPMVGILNKGDFTTKDLSENSYYATAGYGKDNIIQKINVALRLKFWNNAPTVKEKLRPLDIIAYAYLYKNLRFNPTFEPLKQPLKFNSLINVETFGIDKFDYSKHKEIAKQVTVPYYNGDSDEFIVKLSPKNSNDEIFLAKIQPKATLNETLKLSQSKTSLTNVYLNEHDTLQIPKFDFKIEHSFKELVDKFLSNKNFPDYKITEALQNIDFKLNEKGAVLKSEAKIVISKTSYMIKEEPKKLIFDKPFLIYLKEKQSSKPYLVIWVDNTDLLVKK